MVSGMMGTFYLEMILFGDQHRLQSIESSLLLFVGDKHAPLLAVKRSINTGYGSKLKTIILKALNKGWELSTLLKIYHTSLLDRHLSLTNVMV